MGGWPTNCVKRSARADRDSPAFRGVHVHYQETVLRIRDGRPKFKDSPKEMGGSGVTLQE
jgi:hypothetical protein